MATAFLFFNSLTFQHLLLLTRVQLRAALCRFWDATSWRAPRSGTRNASGRSLRNLPWCARKRRCAARPLCSCWRGVLKIQLLRSHLKAKCEQLRAKIFAFRFCLKFCEQGCLAGRKSACFPACVRLPCCRLAFKRQRKL